MYFSSFMRPVKRILLVACLHACAQSNQNMLDQLPTSAEQSADRSLHTVAQPAPHDVPILAVKDGVSLVSTVITHATAVLDISEAYQSSNVGVSTRQKLILQHQLQGKTYGVRALALQTGTQEGLRAVVHMDNGALIKIPHHDVDALPQHIDQEKLACALEQGLIPFLGQHVDGSYRLSFQAKGLGGMHRCLGKRLGDSLSAVQRKLLSQPFSGGMPHRIAHSFAPVAPVLHPSSVPFYSQITLLGVKDATQNRCFSTTASSSSKKGEPRKKATKAREKSKKIAVSTETSANYKPLISFDYAIKYLLRDKGEYEIVGGFISALLKTKGYKEVKIIALLESESNREDSKSKRSLADVVVEDENHHKYIIEIERNVKDSFIHKSCFNTSRLIVDNLAQREDYTQILKIFHISLLYFPLGENKGTIYHGKTIINEVETKERLSVHIKNKKTGESFDATDILPEYFFISVPSFNDRLEREIDEWLHVMKYDEVPKNYHSPYMAQVAEKLSVLKMTKEERVQYSYYQKQLYNDRDELRAAEAKGEAKGKSEMILGMHEDGLSKERIATIAKITVIEVEKILANQPNANK
jgi:predicted transposase/invertase (TIGR01784 family)